METILIHLVKTWDLIEKLVIWANDNPLAAVFFGVLLYNILESAARLTKTKIDDKILAILKNAVMQALTAAFSKKKKP